MAVKIDIQFIAFFHVKCDYVCFCLGLALLASFRTKKNIYTLGNKTRTGKLDIIRTQKAVMTFLK